ncbi:MAG: MgtC/SapB family protein [Leptospirillia bacterium]
MTLSPSLPPLLVSFVLTVLFCFVLGLELHAFRRASEEKDQGFGTTRTLTLSGILGFVLLALDPSGWLLIAGLFVLTALLLVNYKGHQAENPSLIPHLMALLAYVIGPVAQKEPLWFLMVFLVAILLILGKSPLIRRLSDSVPISESVTLATFLVMAGIILPFLPNTPIADIIPVTYTRVWIAVIMVSGVSYLSYLARTYLFPDRGILITGTLGGLYSSTVATVVLARIAKTRPSPQIATSIILASSMMYIRMALLVILIGPQEISRPLLLPYGILFLLSLATAWATERLGKAKQHGEDSPAPSKVEGPVAHPLELRTAFLFAMAFLLFATLTRLIVDRFGAGGLHVLAVSTGVTDITPFVLSLLSGHFAASAGAIEGAIILAGGSNNLINGIYALAIARSRSILPALVWLSVAFLFSLGYSIFLG